MAETNTQPKNQVLGIGVIMSGSNISYSLASQMSIFLILPIL
jgi:hypothetical protein